MKKSYRFTKPDWPWLEDLINWNIQHGSIMATPEGEQYANDFLKKIGKEKP